MRRITPIRYQDNRPVYPVEQEELYVEVFTGPHGGAYDVSLIRKGEVFSIYEGHGFTHRIEKEYVGYSGLMLFQVPLPAWEILAKRRIVKFSDMLGIKPQEQIPLTHAHRVLSQIENIILTP